MIYKVKVLLLTCARKGVIMAPSLANDDEVPRPDARIDVGYTCREKQEMTFYHKIPTFQLILVSREAIP